ncbi:MAG TPA: hypothetical protein VHM70_23590 [Polyangiaceae bacterium]|nr:hypothetical protein [Polyangiaceae bacterium]
MMRLWLTRLRTRVLVLSASAAFALGKGCASAPLPEPTTAGLQSLLQTAAGVEIRPGEVGWEPSRGPVADVLLGRRLLFLGAKRGQLRDVYRAEVTVSWEGKPLRVRALRNLTQTPLADELALQVAGPYATYSTTSFDKLVAVSVLASGSSQSLTRPLEWLRAHWHAYRESGAWDGLRQTHFDVSGVNSVAVALRPPVLSLNLGADREFAFDLERNAWAEGDAANVSLGPGSGTRLSFWRAANDTSPIFGGWSTVRRLFEHEPALAVSLASSQGTSKVNDAEEAAPAVWPPASLQITGAEHAPADGQWVAAGPALGNGEPALLFRTELSALGQRVSLVAIDTRRIELHLQSGARLPHPWTGPNGPGRLPTDVAARERIVAAFGGGLVTDDAARSLGLTSEAKVIVPARSGLPTVVASPEGRIGFGTWDERSSAATPWSLLRQSLTPLPLDVHGDAGGPSHTRTALCRARNGTLLYTWSADCTRGALGAAAAQAGARVCVELDDSPDTGFALIGANAGALKSEPLLPSMRLPEGAFVEATPRDFFYLERIPSALRQDQWAWQLSPGTQPEPAYIPGLFSAHTDVGGLSVELFSVDPGRARLSVIAGSEEPLLTTSVAPVRELSPDEQARALFAFNLGHTTRATRYGLSFDSKETLPLRRVYPTLVLHGDGRVEVMPAGQTPTPAPDTILVQLPALLSAGELLPRAREAGPQRPRGALCVHPDGRLLAAFAEHDSSDPIALVLRDAGCTEVLELDRASQHAATLFRTGTQLPPPSTSETSLLVGLSQPMAQRTFAF